MSVDRTAPRSGDSWLGIAAAAERTSDACGAAVAQPGPPRPPEYTDLVHALERMTAGFALFDAEDRLIWCNRAFRDLEPRVAPKIRPADRSVDRKRALAAAGMPAAPSKEEQSAATTTCLLPATVPRIVSTDDGRFFQIDERCTSACGRVLLLSDVTAIKQREEACALLAAVVEQAGDAIEVRDHQGHLVYVNPAFTRLTGYSPEDVLGQRSSHLLSAAADGSGRETAPEPSRALAQSWSGRIVSRRKDGSLLHQETAISPLRDRYGQITHFVAAKRNVAEPDRSEAHLRYLAHHDPLTELPNRTLFQRRLQAALTGTREGRAEGAVLVLDLDHFKDINDTLGHTTGDAFLRSVAGRLLACMRETDTVCRLGGDEFAILQLPATSAEAVTLVRRVSARLAEPFYIHGREIHTSASIGIALFPRDSCTAEQLMKQADLALYRAKAEGRETFHFFLPDFEHELEQRLALGRELRGALKAGQLALEYQPLVDIRRMMIAGVEALVRWRHPERGPIPPVQFVPIAEETGMIGPLTGWVLREACGQARAWHEDGLRVSVAVNLSPVQFRQRGVEALVAQTLEATGLPGHCLELDVTERVLLRDPERAQQVLDALTAQGVQIALDDFGTGTSSLTSLRRFPFSKVKIDKSLVGEMSTNPAAAAIIRAVITLGNSLRIRVTAEGVETEEQFAALRAEGCEEAQGYLFARPLPAVRLLPLLQQSRRAQEGIIAAPAGQF